MGWCRIRNWEIVEGDDGSERTRFKERRLRGEVWSHPNHPDGTVITTSVLVSSSGRVLTTRTGLDYQLIGPPAPAYVEWCRKNGVCLNPDEPVVIKTKPSVRKPK